MELQKLDAPSLSDNLIIRPKVQQQLIFTLFWYKVKINKVKIIQSKSKKSPVWQVSVS